MSTAIKQYVAKLSKFLLEQELPDSKGIANKDPQSPSTSSSPLLEAVPIFARDHVTQVALETCHCIHFQEYLPHMLDLELCKAKDHPRGWVVANPVHALHLESQIEDSLPASSHWKHPPLLYGEEQQRTLALSTEGIVEYWCPLDGRSAVIHDDTAVEKKEQVPIQHPIGNRRPSQLSGHPQMPTSGAHPSFIASANGIPTSPQQKGFVTFPVSAQSPGAKIQSPSSQNQTPKPAEVAPSPMFAKDTTTETSIQSTSEEPLATTSSVLSKATIAGSSDHGAEAVTNKDIALDTPVLSTQLPPGNVTSENWDGLQ